MTTWQFSSAIDKERVTVLLQAPALNEIIEMLLCQIDVLCCHRQNCDDVPGFSRAVFNLRTSQRTFDLFFNSEHGYRGSYYLSPHEGLAANKTIIKQLSPLLLSWAEQHEPMFDQVFTAESLSSLSAKMWLTEYGSHLCAQCVSEWGNPTDNTAEILNDRWELADTPNARRGRKAPFLSKIRVSGAFLNERNDEIVPARKRHRATDINAGGWS